MAAGKTDLATAPRLGLAGVVAEGRLGWTVAPGHLDGDGQADLMVAAPWAAAATAATAGLFYGLRGPLPAGGRVDLVIDSAALLVQGTESGAGNAGATV